MPDNTEPDDNSTNSDSFRNKIATVDDSGNRLWIYPHKPKGTLHRARVWVGIGLIAFFVIAPFIKINNHPFLLFNILERHFVIFGKPFFPQDFHLFVLAFIAIIVFVFLFTVIYGRIFCGWICPQTVFMEIVFRKIEFWIEGSATKQRSRNKRPMDGEKLFRKTLKHSVFFLIAFIVANIFMVYLTGTKVFFDHLTSSPLEAPSLFLSVVCFAGVFYFVFAFFREQACTLVCPYGRLQGALLDKKSIIITYDWIRGEPRVPPKKAKDNPDAGDCIDCLKCVQVCPTGIDIRNGTQLECVNCTACVDACNSIMDRVKRPRGLIRYASHNSIETGERIKFNSRMAGYSAVLLLLLSLLTFMLIARSDVEATILRTPGMMFYTTENGDIQNLYSLKMINKSYSDLPINLKISSPLGGTIQIIGNEPNISAQQLYEGALMVTFPRELVNRTKTRIEIDVYSNEQKLETVKTSFMGPAN